MSHKTHYSISLIIALLLAFTPACTRRNRVAQNTGEYTLQAGGLERTYRLHVPLNFDGNLSWPLVFVFHGGYGTGEVMEEVTGFDQVADEKGFIVVYPNGYIDHWNDGRSTDPTYTDVDDVRFVSALIDELSSKYNIDPKRVFATGMSNGGIFTYRLACELSDRLAAVGPVSGSLAENLVPQCSPAQTISIIHIHGLDDQLVKFEGGTVPSPYGGVTYPVLDTLALWIDFDGCTGSPETTELPDSDPSDGTTVRMISYTHCQNNTVVTLYAIAGGGHTWPGGEYTSEGAGGKTSHDFSASEVIWEFFSQHPKP